MSYQVLARKYRPHSFEELVGQEHVVQALANALTQQRLHHAYLFTGTRGVGKTTVSRILAKSLNCLGADGLGQITAKPCGVCDACRDIDAGRFVDYVELDAASNRGVEEISQLLDQAVYKPVVGRFKVYMIDEVHMLSNTAFNAMLKTLEEPPDYLKFVLATTDPQKVPVTVLSRCLQFNLRPMAPQNVLSHLTHVLQAEAVPAEQGALRLLARAARGSMRDALSLTDQAIAFGSGALSEAGVRQMLGSVDRGHVVAIIDALVASQGAALVAQSDALRDLGLSAPGTLEDLANLLQQLAIQQVAPGSLDPDDPDTAEVIRLAPQLPADELQVMYSMALHGRAELSLAPDEYAGLTMVLLRMLSFRPAQGGVQPQNLSRPAVSTPAPAQTPRPAAPVASAPLLSPAPPSLRAELRAERLATAPVAAPAQVSAVHAEPVLPVALVASVAASVTEVREPSPPARSVQARPAGVGRSEGSSQNSSHSARLRPRPAAASEAPPDDDLPPWLDAPPASDEDGVATLPTEQDVAHQAAPHSTPASSSNGEGAYASTGGRDIVLQPTALGERWAQQVKQLSLVALPRELAMQAECIAVDEQAEPALWRLRVERESLRQPALAEKLQAALATALGRAVKLEIEAGMAQDSPALRESAQSQARQREAEHIILQDPFVKEMLSQFKTARIVPGSIKPH
jgi:DNA polymerase-3 subunit gamma/tau